VFACHGCSTRNSNLSLIFYSAFMNSSALFYGKYGLKNNRSFTVRPSLIIFLCTVTLLTGCASTVEQSWARDQHFASICRGYGLKPMTEPYFQCMSMVENQSNNQDQANSQMLLKEAQRLLAPVQSNVKTCTPAMGAPPGTLVCR
jgi:hypothetical protein